MTSRFGIGGSIVCFTLCDKGVDDGDAHLSAHRSAGVAVQNGNIDFFPEAVEIIDLNRGVIGAHFQGIFDHRFSAPFSQHIAQHAAPRPMFGIFYGDSRREARFLRLTLI